MPEKIEQQEPAAVIDQLSHISEPRIVVLDFDETIFLRNSTEHYLDSVRPQALGALLLIILEILRPWDWLPRKVRGIESRDWVRVVAATILFPWTLPLWRRRARQLVREHENHELAQAVADNPRLQPIIATHGFAFIVKPLARHLSLKTATVAGCRFLRGVLDRQQGKEELLARHLTPQELAAAVVVTDSRADLSLLEIVQIPFFVQWPAAHYIPAMSNAYFPLFYLECVKRPGQRYIRWAILEIHLPALLLAYSWISGLPPLHAAGLAALIFSFWCIYEIGYFENDKIAETREKEPALSATYHQYHHRMSLYQPWWFAAPAGLLGVLLIQLGDGLDWSLRLSADHLAQLLAPARLGLAFAAWMAVLLATRLIFAAYNHSDVQSRIWIFPVLQICKYFSFLAVAAINIVGVLLLVSQVFVDWVPYLIYRCGGRRELVQEQILRLFIFLMLAAAFALALRDTAMFCSWQFLAVLAWLAYRSKDQFAELLKTAGRIRAETSS